MKGIRKGILCVLISLGIMISNAGMSVTAFADGEDTAASEVSEAYSDEAGEMPAFDPAEDNIPETESEAEGENDTSGDADETEVTNDGSTSSYTLSVGGTQQLRASTTYGTAISYLWSSNSDSVGFTSVSNSSIATIKVFSYPGYSSPVIIQCEIYWQKLVNGQIKTGRDMCDFRITVNKPKYTVKLDANGGSVGTSSLTVEYGDSYGYLPDPTRAGYLFAGWYKSNGTRVYSTTTVSEDHTLYAHWDSDYYRISFNGNGSTSGSMIGMVCDVGETETLTANGFEKDGCVFAGWNTKADGSGTSYSDKASVRDLSSGGNTVTLYAVWKTTDKDIANCRIVVSPASYDYTGTAVIPFVTVSDGNDTLKENTDYKLSYKDNLNVGTAYVTVKGTGQYKGTAEKTFTITKAAQALTAEVKDNKVYVGKDAQISVTGAVGDVTYTSGNTSAVTVSNTGLLHGVAAGTAVITIKASRAVH